MQHCTSCGSELPDQAQFCGYCGHVLDTTTGTATNPGTFPGVDVLSRNAPTTLSGPSQAVRMSEQQPGLDVSRFPASQSQEVEHLPAASFMGQKEEEDEERRRRGLLPLPLLGLLADAPPGNMPMVQGTPQVGVPVVQGTPSMPFSPPSGQGFPPGSTPSFPHSGPWGPPTSPTYPHPGPFPHPTPTPAPAPHPSPGPSSPGCVPVWFAIIVVIIIVFSGIGSFFLFLPTPSLSGPADVTPGDAIQLHGTGFIGGGSITLSLDGVALVLSGENIMGNTQYPDTTSVAALSQIALARQLKHSVASGGTIQVNSSGTFDATITISATLPLGTHTIHASEEVIGVGIRGADLKFNIVSQQAKLNVKTTSLDFGQLQAGTTATLSVVISNAGGQKLTWTADTGGTEWLSLPTNTGTIDSGQPEQAINVTANAGQLSVGKYTATLEIKSNGGNTQVGINLEVIPQSQTKQAKLDASPTTLDYGTLPVGSQAVQVITISNAGTLALSWQVDSGNTSWLTLDTTSGTIEPGAVSQTVQVTVNTTNLTPQSYSATIQVSSNGGNAQVQVTLVVTGATPTPTPSPTPVPVILKASPSSLNGNTDCKYAASAGWSCVVTLSNTSNQSSLNWSASSSGASFRPSQGTLSPGQTTQVSVSVPANTVCPTKIDLAFKGPANTVHVSWSCQAPTLSVSPASLTARDCPFSNGHYVCTVTVSDDEGGARWSASSDKTGVSFNPQSGTVYPGGSTVTIFIPRTPCPASVNLIFTETDTGKSVTVVWKC